VCQRNVRVGLHQVCLLQRVGYATSCFRDQFYDAGGTVALTALGVRLARHLTRVRPDESPRSVVSFESFLDAACTLACSSALHDMATDVTSDGGDASDEPPMTPERCTLMLLLLLLFLSSTKLLLRHWGLFFSLLCGGFSPNVARCLTLLWCCPPTSAITSPWFTWSRQHPRVG